MKTKIKSITNRFGWHLYRIPAARAEEAREIYNRGVICNEFAIVYDYGRATHSVEEDGNCALLKKCGILGNIAHYKLKDGKLFAESYMGATADESVEHWANYSRRTLEEEPAPETLEAIRKHFAEIAPFTTITPFLKWDSWDKKFNKCGRVEFDMENSEVKEFVEKYRFALERPGSPWDYCYKEGNKFAGTRAINADPIEHNGTMFLVVYGRAPKVKKRFEYLGSYIRMDDEYGVYSIFNFGVEEFLKMYDDGKLSR